MNPNLQASIERFQKEMSEINAVTHVLLKGHLLIEERLTGIIEQHIFHREHLVDARLQFHQKLSLCKSLCLRKNKVGEWELLSALNTLRNDLAHRLDSADRQRKIDRVKELYFREAAGLDGIEELRKSSDEEIVMFACAHCEGFLVTFEWDAKALRGLIHAMDRTMNPDQPAFEL